MNRYPLWKYILIAFTLVVGLVYTLPNFFGEVPAVQVSPVRASAKADASTLKQIEAALSAARLPFNTAEFDGNSLKLRFATTEMQLKAKDVIATALGDNYTVALNLVSASPAWLTAIGARPMYLGLDLRGGVHFLLEVDMAAALDKAASRYQNDFRTDLRSEKIRYSRIQKAGQSVIVHFSTRDQRDTAVRKLTDSYTDLTFLPEDLAEEFTLTAKLKPEAQKREQELALQQNIITLRNRVNELGVAEPVIQQQGANRIVVQLPGVQDTAKAKDILGRTATLEVRMVDDASLQGQGAVPSLGVEVFPDSSDGTPVHVKKEVVLSGDRFKSAQPSFDQNSQPAVSVSLDSVGGRVMKDLTRESIGKFMAIVLFERGKGEAVSVARIQGEFSNSFQITGSFTTEETTRLALLIRAGALAAPMQIVEERTVGPSMGAENISKGFHSNIWGFAAVAAFMIIYYRVFGLFSTLALAVNGFFLIALLSMLQATLTLPGMAAIALTLGMAIDANVLINERIREELRHGTTPQAAIHAGYDRAWGTILDSNLTTLIAGIALFWLGSGPVRGFAVVLCLGILTSMFSAVTISRAMANLTYGRQSRLAKVSI